VIRDITGIRTIKAESGKSFSINSGLWAAVLSRKIPLSVTLIKDPDFSEKIKMLPLKNINDNTVINERYTD
jgi:hypothetical protein